jgi:hypothetical protein
MDAKTEAGDTVNLTTLSTRAGRTGDDVFGHTLLLASFDLPMQNATFGVPALARRRVVARARAVEGWKDLLLPQPQLI